MSKLDYLVGVMSIPKRPFATIMGGSKVSYKIRVLKSLLEKVDIIHLGGGLFSFYTKPKGSKLDPYLLKKERLNLLWPSCRNPKIWVFSFIAFVLNKCRKQIC